MKTRLMGDVHGLFYDIPKIMEKHPCESVIQIGDMGVGFVDWDEEKEHFGDMCQKYNMRFIRGNHDNPGVCKDLVNEWIPDGTIMDDVMFIGGAWSIDWQFRSPGISWWDDEELSTQQLFRMIDLYETTEPRVMITHDAPLSITEEMFIKSGRAIFGKNAKSIPTRTGMAFETMFSLHQPDFWIFGHWHHTCIYKKGKTVFLCLDELDYIDVDLSDSEDIANAIYQKFI